MKLGGYSHCHGYETRFDEDSEEWVYADDLSSISNERPCQRCGMLSTIDGHDACLANLPGVINACCGHGVLDKDNYPYVMFVDKTTLRGEEAKKWIKENNRRQQMTNIEDGHERQEMIDIENDYAEYIARKEEEYSGKLVQLAQFAEWCVG